MTAIMFKTAEEYEAQCQRCTDYGIQLAGERIWEALKADVEHAWDKEDEYRSMGCAEGDRQAKNLNRRTQRMLSTYQTALAAIGFNLEYSLDHFDKLGHIHDVFCTHKGFGVGSLRSCAKASWDWDED